MFKNTIYPYIPKEVLKQTFDSDFPTISQENII